MQVNIVFALILMGFTSLIVQTLLIREFLISFYGNELTIGLILANWIILEALGSSLVSKISIRIRRPYLIYPLLQAGIALYLPLSIFMIRNIKNIIGTTHGETVGILPVFFSSFLIILPLSLFDGAEFPFGCKILSDASKRSQESVGKVYILEAVGFILAGPLFTYLLITKLNSFSIALVVGLLNLASGILLLKNKIKESLSKRLFVFLLILLGILLTINLIAIEKINSLSISLQWKTHNVLTYRNSIYGNLVVTESKNQYTFYSNGIPIITIPVSDITRNEELVHFIMLSHPNPKNVLLLGGTAGGIIKEILKYPIQRLTYTELDPLLIDLIKKFPTELTDAELKDKRLDIRYIDARRYLQITKSKYDVVIFNLPMPSTLQLNRFYTKEFFQIIKSALNENGVFGFGLSGSLSYMNLSLQHLNGSVLNSLQDIFYVNIIPGDFNIYICSLKDLKLDYSILANRLKEKDIPTLLINEPHLRYRMDQRWRDWFFASLGDYTKIRKNLDLLPSATFYSIAYWNSIFSAKSEKFFQILDKISFKLIFFALVLTGLVFFFLVNTYLKIKRLAVASSILTTGFVGMSLDLIFIYTYQVFYGFVFSHIGILVTAFMAGLTCGAWLMTKNIKQIKKDVFVFSAIELKIASFCFLTALLLFYLNRLNSLKLSFIFFILSFISGYLVGSEFPLANKIYSQNKMYSKTAGILYALDLTGAYFAAIVVSIILVPVLGVLKTLLLLGLLKIISFLAVFISKI